MEIWLRDRALQTPTRHYARSMTTWVLLAGPPATGKSTLAGALEKRLDATTLNKDRVREVLFPGRMTDYTPEQDALCMRAMLDAAAYLTTRQRVAFILFDGRSFARRRQVEEVLQAAESAGAGWRILSLSCADEVVRERLDRANPEYQAHPARNRNMDLYRRVKQSFEPILHPKLDVDTTKGVETVLNAVMGYLMHGAG